VTALALMLLLIAAWRKRDSFQPFSLIANYGLILMGSFLFLMQMHGYEHTINVKGLTMSNKLANETEKNKAITPPKQEAIINIIIFGLGEQEYKIYLDKGSIFDYTWKTDGAKLFYDFHGEPVGDTRGYFKSFKKATESESQGSLTTIFAGTHGWYWKNNNANAVTIVLQIIGNYQRLDIELPPDPALKSNISNHDSIF